MSSKTQVLIDRAQGSPLYLEELMRTEDAGEGIAVADLDFERQDRARRELPALSHTRLL